MEKEQENRQKPITMMVEEFKSCLSQVVAESGLPPFLLELILGEMLSGISNVAKKEYDLNRKEWEKASREGEKNG